jgi:hypothetical protein
MNIVDKQSYNKLIQIISNIVGASYCTKKVLTTLL